MQTKENIQNRQLVKNIQTTNGQRQRRDNYNPIEQLQEHDVTQYHLCTKCGDYFANKNRLQMVVDQL